MLKGSAGDDGLDLHMERRLVRIFAETPAVPTEGFVVFLNQSRKLSR
jgi:hypothetical protein